MLRLLWSAYQALRASRVRLAALPILAVAGLVALSVAVAVVWFGYAVAHSKKDIWSDFKVVLLTGLPFYAVSYALWHLAKHVRSAIGVRAAPPGIAADASPAARR
jgi:hypothetical protein